jgi:hypothetical protein
MAPDPHAAGRGTNPDLRHECNENGFCLFKTGGTFAEVAANVAASRADK